MTDDLDRLDRLCATEIMGWVFVDDRLTGWGDKENLTFYYLLDDWQPTRNIAQAWELLEKLENIESIKLINYDRQWECIIRIQPPDKIFDVNQFVGLSETAPHAIVLACLKAKGIVYG